MGVAVDVEVEEKKDILYNTLRREMDQMVVSWNLEQETPVQGPRKDEVPVQELWESSEDKAAATHFL